MRSLLCVVTIFMLSATIAHALIRNEQLKCESSPLYILFEQYYEGHPFRNVNLARNESHWDIDNYNIQFNSLKNYRLRKRVGGGSFGNVIKATYTPDGSKYAFKQLLENDMRSIKEEVQILKEISDLPNVLPLRDVIQERTPNKRTKIGMVFDYFKTGNYEKMFPTLSKIEVKHFIYDTLKTLHLAHSRGIVHRDIKPLNVLMNAKRRQTRVIDWGQSGYFLPGKRYHTAYSTIDYMAPELLMDYAFHGYAIDIWSTGCMLAEMSFLKSSFFQAKSYTPFSRDYSKYTIVLKKRSREQLKVVAKVLGTLELRQYADKFRDEMDLSQLDNIGEYKKVPFVDLVNEQNYHLVDLSLIDLLEKMLTYDHTRRITAAEALMHPYFDAVRDSKF